MVAAEYLDVLRIIHARLSDGSVNWALIGSLGLALQGVPVEVHDIDLQTDAPGAYEIERHLSEFSVKKVSFSASEGSLASCVAISLKLRRDASPWQCSGLSVVKPWPEAKTKA